MHIIDLLSTIVMTVGSALLFCYWFRYACLLILNAKTARDHTSEFAITNRLQFSEIESQLRSHAPLELDRLHRALLADYVIVCRLLSAHALALSEERIESRMLQIHYWLASVWYRASHRLSSPAARRALEEMCLILAHFANCIGEHTASTASA